MVINTVLSHIWSYMYNNVAKQELKHVVNSCEQNICKIGMCIQKVKDRGLYSSEFHYACV